MAIRKSGFFIRKCDQKKIQRYRCLVCKKSFSHATQDICYRQKKRHLNIQIYHKLCGGFSKRRTAIVLETNRKTVIRKFRFLAGLAFEITNKQNLVLPKVRDVQFDDMETFEHTKFKPVSITLAVENRSRRILSFECSPMPARGLLAKKARFKYGRRKDERPDGRKVLFTKLKSIVSDDCTFMSDQNPHYPPDIKKYFKDHKYQQFKGRRGCIVGQGELKRGGFDPLHTLNHTCAMIRDNLKRMSRRTWCTTKKIEELRNHLAIYVLYHNEFLIQPHKCHRKFRKLIGHSV